MRCADVARRFLTTNVLLAGLQRHAQGHIAVTVFRNTDDTAGHVTLELILSAEESGVWTTKSHRHTEALGVTETDVGTPFTGRRNECERHDVCGTRNKSTTGMHTLCELFVVVDLTAVVRVLNHPADIALIERGCGIVTKHQFNFQMLCTTAQHIDGLRENFVVYKKLICSCLFFFLRHAVQKQDHRFCSSCSFIEQGGVGNRQSCKVAHHGLEVE